ncbi:MAG: GNAT family N-acetyltransferase [Chloroflexota bacterium]|nr:GNAT family N-acetyltransferase [Chloroflexota bacterium]
MPQALNLIIRDALPDDIAGCVALDHAYETDHVWQMHMRQDDGYLTHFRSERLPRTLEATHQPDPARLRDGLAPDRLFVAACDRDSGELLAYLLMSRDIMRHTGHIVDFAVDRPVRRCGIGRRLMDVAAAWAREQQISRIQITVETTNQPAIAFVSALGYSLCGYNDRYFPNRDIALFFTQVIR